MRIQTSRDSTAVTLSQAHVEQDGNSGHSPERVARGQQHSLSCPPTSPMVGADYGECQPRARLRKLGFRAPEELSV